MSEPARKSVEALGPKLIDAIRAQASTDRLREIKEIFDDAELARVGPERIEAQLLSIAERYPGLEFGRAELTEMRMSDRISRVLHVYARAPGDKLWRDLQLYVSPAAPPRLQRLVFIAEVSEPIALPNGDLASPGTMAWLDRYVDRLADEYELSGSILIAKGGRLLLERPFGFSDARRSRPITRETLFSLASASKMFTALAVARLAADGRISYGDSVAKYFPELSDRQLDSRVTIRHLLSHSSGVAEYWTNETADAVRAAGSTAEMLPLVLRAGKAFDPGSRYAYSNSNYILAGLIVERVSGRPFPEFVEELIFKPLHMGHTKYVDPSSRADQIAESLGRDGKGWKAQPRGRRGTAAGGCLSTAADMLLFVRGMNSGEVVPQSELAKMVTSQVAPGVESDGNYGLGFLLQQNGGVSSYGHGGIARGVNAEIRYFPSLDVTLILLCNQDNGAYDDLRKNATRLITGER